MSLSARAIARRAKKYLRENPLDLFLVVLPGMEDVARSEVMQLFPNPSLEPGGVGLRGNISTVYELNLRSRVGSRVLMRLATFLAQTYPMLYDHTRKIPWEIFLGSSQDIEVRVAFGESRLRHINHIKSVILDAISSRMGGGGQGQSGAKQAGPARIHVRLHRDRCTVSLDTTGEHLHKRGYRLAAGRAPIRETIAAGILAMARSVDYDVVLDPFCGSGTFCIEADLAARNVAPGQHRRFAIESAPLFTPGVVARTRRAIEEQQIATPSQRILGLDIDEHTVETASANAKRARTRLSGFQVGDATSFQYSALRAAGERGLVVTNLPYGRRLSTRSGAEDTFRAFQRRLGESASGWDFAIATVTPDAIDNRWLQVRRQVRLVNGGLRVAVLFGNVR